MESVYFIEDVERGCIKIGTSRDVKRRLCAIRSAASHVNRKMSLRILATVEGGRAVERHLHELFATHRENGEWFKPVPELHQYIREHATPYGAPHA